ncbi:HSP40/DnaJ peptide-binding [Pseudocohnilembus persalinus]|uniref:HSP40/DnaJ peptide-binding n=1 Tax=Pseudocohnilembus persalinus TaxID=266149 RepID=A0A0V0R254_PSEPJ|nr:HSP40/DnaJ peptide-binding [Pseudocohnilembus persalinus]|eukprot:KRX08588.1 HSP40/DnaJ peptide-binding [Pseudocohnilembus persalinus]
MSKDYYQILEIERDASDQEIARAYRVLSLRWHPKLCQQEDHTQKYYFSKISEAFEVLSDPIKRAFFDKYGEDKLKQGLFSQGELKGGYRFKNNPEEIFNKFYQENNAFAKLFDSEGNEEYGSLFGSQFGGQRYKGISPLENLTVKVQVTLEEIYNGCSKVIKYPKQVLNNDSRTTSIVEEERQIWVPKGSLNGATIKLEGQGNQGPQQKNSDLIIIIEEMAHKVFKRKGNNLYYTQTLNLVEALGCSPVNLRTLDGRDIFVPIDQMISPSYKKEVKGEGMPIDGQVDKDVKTFGKEVPKGNLYINFNIIFPKQIPENDRTRIKELLA